jgi:outer membrane immunogenic protein
MKHGAGGMMRYPKFLGLVIGFQPVAAIAAPFDGVFFGVQSGAVDRSTSLRIGDAKIDGSKTDIAYGAFVGYDLAIDRFVVGAQAEVNGGAGNILAHDDEGTFNDVDPKWGYAVSARAGFLALPRTLIYGRIGYAAERTREVFGGQSILIVAIPPRPEWHGGLQLGGGAEFAATRKISVRAEYRHNDYWKTYHANQFLIGAAFHF